MKKLTRLLAVVLAVLMLATAFAGCHKKNEIAFTIGDSEFTSAMYSCSLYFAATTARNQIYTFVSDAEGDTKNIKYESYKFDAEGNVSKTGTISYEKFVRTTAVDQLKRFAALEAIFAEGKLTVSDDVKTTNEYNALSYWNYGCDYNTYMQYAQSGQLNSLSYSYMPDYYLLEKNGVSLETYKKYYFYDAMYSFYFDHLYGEKGEKAVSKDDINKYMTETYAIGNVITFSKKDSDNKDLSDTKLKEIKAIADGYAERLNKGEDFEAIYKEENKRVEEANKTTSSSVTTSTLPNNSTNSSTTSSTASSTTSSATSSATTSSEAEKEYTPAEYTGIFGKEDTNYEHPLFSEIIKQDIGKAVVLEDKENSQYMLIVRLDMLEEEYWYKNLRTSISYDLKQEEFDKGLDDKGNALKLTEDTFATKPFTVKKIKLDVEE